jgi:membrane-anchored protein YejM (alkaline phosphatase superfamily)
VIFLSVDTMRRDAIGKRFGARKVAPNLERFGAESVFFARATSAAPGTLYSMGSLLTGYSIDQLLWQRAVPKSVFTRTRKRFDAQRMFLPDWSSVRSAAFKRLIRQKTSTQYVPRRADPAKLFIDALDAARQKSQRVFYWLHLVDAHAPYRTHEGFDFGDDKAARYYSEIAYDDAILGRVLDHMRATGWLESYVLDLRSGAEHIYDRARDAAEKHDHIAARGDLLSAFRARVAAWRREEAQRITCDVLR